jgi:pimeloyl-ACP methyl ester carboxylesterase/acyl-CoA thioesterase FadM
MNEDLWTMVAESSTLGERLAVHRTTKSPDGLPAMVLIHGLEDDWRTWGLFAERMSGHFGCYALDLPWRTGGDHGWRQNATATQWVEAALSLIPEPITVITAHSLGANLVLQWLATGARPEAAALVLVSPFYLPSSRAVSWRTFERAVADFRTMMGEGLRVRLGARAQSLDPEILDLMTVKVLDRIGPRGFFAGFEEYLSASGLALGDVRTPALLIAGDQDPGLTGGAAEALAADMPAVELAVRPEFTHFCHVEQSAETAELVLSFLERHRSASATKGRPAMTAVTTSYRGRPRYEGANISTIIGFKNLMFQAEDAVLGNFRERGHGPQELFERYGLGLEIVDSSVWFTNILHVDDEVTGKVEAAPATKGPGEVCKVRLHSVRAEGETQVMSGRLRVALVEEKDGIATAPIPEELRHLVVPEVAAVGGGPASVPLAGDAAATLAPPGGFVWSWQIPYYYCHWYTRLQSSGYVRLLEEASDRYLAHVGLPITGMLAQRDWIPLVSRARVRMHADAYMGETLHITFEVDDIVKDTLFTATMACHVARGDELVRVATCTIMHAYGIARGPRAFSELIILDDETQRALRGGAR